MVALDDLVMLQSEIGIRAFGRVIDALDGQVFRDDDGIEDVASGAITQMVDSLTADGLDMLDAMLLIADGKITRRGSRSDAAHFDLVLKRPQDGVTVAGCSI